LPVKTSKKSNKGNPPKRGFPWFLRIGIGLGVVLIAIAIAFFFPASPANLPDQTDGLKCAIVDQLYSAEPNQVFTEYITQRLENFGFEVDVYRGDEVNVDFYRQLPTRGYKLIIFRIHSGLLRNEEGISDKIWLFTNEPYTRMRYFIAQLRDQIRAAGISTDSTPVFALSTRFVTDCTKGTFANTVIINMGCAALHSDEMAKAFIQKGASLYLGWDVSVGLRYVDNATMTLVEKLCSQERTIAEAVSDTMKEKGPDPNNNAFLKFYPQDNANKTLRELLEQ
jgi:hypothetical protein